MSDEQSIQEAVHSLKSGELSEEAFWIVVKNILHPITMTSEDKEWADQQIKRLTKTRRPVSPEPPGEKAQPACESNSVTYSSGLAVERPSGALDEGAVRLGNSILAPGVPESAFQRDAEPQQVIPEECELCGGTGEVEIGEKGAYPCPTCVAKDLRERLGAAEQRATEAYEIGKGQFQGPMEYWRKKYEELQAERDRLKEQLAQINGEHLDALHDIASLKLERDYFEAEVAGLKEQLAAYQAIPEEIVLPRHVLVAKVAELEGQLAQQLSNLRFKMASTKMTNPLFVIDEFEREQK